MRPEGPYVAVAALCDAVLDEKNNRISCIRFLDKIDVNVAGDESALATWPGIPVPVWGFLSFKSGEFVGKKIITIALEKPNGERASPVQSYPAVFQGKEHGINLILQFMIETKESGLFWFDVMIDEECATRIPLRIVINQTATDAIAPESLKSEQSDLLADDR
jgi:hypothetical protein